MCHNFETSVLAYGCKFLTGLWLFELVEAVLLKFFAMVGGGSEFIAFFGVVELPRQIEVSGLVGLQSGVAIVAMPDVELPHPKGSSRVLTPLLPRLRTPVQRCHIN